MNPRIIEKTTIIKDLLPSATSTTNAKPFIVRIPQLQTKSPHPLDTNKVFIVKTNPLATPTATPNVTSPNISFAAPTQSGAKFSVVKLADGQLVLVPTAATSTTTTPTTQPLVINENSISRIIKASSTSPPNPTGVISTIKRVTKEPTTTPRISTIQIKNLSSSATNFKSPSAQERRLRAIAPAPSALATATSELFNSFFPQQQQQFSAASAENLLRFDPTASVLLGEEDSLPVISETITVDSNGSSLKNLSNHKRKLDSLPIEQKTSLPVVASVPSTPAEPPPPPPAPPKPKTPVRKTSNHEEKPITKTKTTSAANKETTKKVTTKQSNASSNSITPTFRPSAEHKKPVVPPTPTTPKIDPEEGIRMKICETILRSLIGKIEREQNQESIKTRLEKHSTAVPKHEHRQIILTRLLNERVDHLRQEFLKNRQERKTTLVKEQFEFQRQKQQEFIFKQQQQHQQQSSSTNRSELNLSDDDDDDDDDDDETQQLQRSVSPPTKKLKRPTIKIKSLPAKRTRPTDDETPMKKIRRQRQPSDNDENLHRRSSGKNKSKLFSTVNQIIQRKGNKFSGDFHPSNLDCRCRRNDDLQEKFFVQCELCSRWLHGKCAGLTPRLAEKISEFICEECSCLTERAKERLYCICQTPYDDSKFYIGCDVCADWLHGSCVNITPDDADKFEVYVCPRCSTEKKQEFLNKPITGDTRKKLLNLIDQLLSHKMSWPFQKPVDVKDVPNYYKIIKDPMDLTTLKSKVLSHKFKTICDFIRDVNKIFNNCRQFNAIDSTFAQCANVVDNYFRQLLENLMVRDH